MWIFQLYADYQLNQHNPILCQQQELHKLEERYGFAGYEAFTTEFPVMDYTGIAAENLAKADFFARSSGTSSAAKFIPVSEAYLEGNHYKAGRYALYNLLFHFHQIPVLSGANLTLTGYKYPENHLGKEVLDISALMFAKRPALFKAISIPRQIFFSWQEKLDYLLEHPEDVLKVRSISGVPTWMFSLFQAFEAKFQQPTRELFPHLKLVVHGGVDFTHYYDRFRTCFPDRELSFFENYNATEGFYGFQHTPESRDLLLCTNTGIFFEFRDTKGHIYPLWELEAGETYELLISNQDGLLRYQTGDLITIQQLAPVLFRVVGRTSEFINAFGEDLMVSQTDAAMRQLNAAFDLHITDYLAYPVYASTQEMGYHQWYLFTDRAHPDPARWALALDGYLQELNNNYRQKRHRSSALQPLRLVVRPTKTLARLIKSSGNQIGGQAKLKKLYNSPDIEQYLALQPYE